MSKPRILLLGYGSTAESALASPLPRVEAVGVGRKATGRHDPVAVPAAEAIRSTRATLGFGTADLIRLLARPDHGLARQWQEWEKEKS